MSPADRLAELILVRLASLRDGRLDDRYLEVPIEELEPLAREHMARRGGNTLHDAGIVYVTLAAAREYGAAERIHDDDLARQQLTEIAADAKPMPQDPTQWRARTRARGVDVSLRVRRDGRLMVITAASSRPLNAGGRRRVQ